MSTPHGGNPFRWLTQQGIPDIYSPDLRLRLLLTNWVALVVCVTFLPFVFLVEFNVSRVVLLLAVAGYAAVPVLNHRGSHQAGRLITSLVLPLVILFFGTLYEASSIERTFLFKLELFATSVLPLSLFLRRERTVQLLSFGALVLLWLGFDTIDQYFSLLPSVPQTDTQARVTWILQTLVPVVALSIFALSFLGFQHADSRTITNALAEAQRLNQALQQQQDELQGKAASLEEARHHTRRLIKRLRLGQVQVEEQKMQLEEQSYVSSGLVLLSQLASLQPGQSKAQWATELLAQVVSHLNLSAAQIFVYQGGQIRPEPYSYPLSALDSPAASLALLQECAQTGTPVIRELVVPSSHSHHEAVLPLRWGGQTLGVLRTICGTPYESQRRHFFIEAAEEIARYMQAIDAQLQIQSLLAEAQERAAQLLSQEEELRQNIDMLEATSAQMRRVQYQLALNETNLRAIIDNTPDNILLLDTQYRVMVLNETFKARYQKRYGTSINVGDNILVNSEQEEKDIWKARYDRVLVGEVLVFDAERPEGNGIFTQVEYSMHPLRNEQGEMLGFSIFSRDISARIENERMLRELNENLERKVQERTQSLNLSYSVLRTTLETTSEGILVLTAGGRVLEYNRRFAELWNVTQGLPAQGRLSEVLQLILPQAEDPDQLRRVLLEALENDPPVTEDVIETVDGRLILMGSLRPAEVHTAEEVGRVWNFRDITAQRKAEEALRESETRLRIFFDLTNEGIILHENGVVIDVNPAMMRLGGISDKLEDHLGIDAFQFMHPDDREVVLHQLSLDETGTYEMRGIRPDGTVMYVEITSRNLTFSDRTIRAAVVRDLTERKQAEAQLELLARATPVPLVVFGFDDGIIRYANDAFLSTFGYASERVIGQRRKILYYPGEAYTVPFAQLSETGLVNYEIKLSRADGSPIWVIANALPILYQGVKSVIAGMVDVSDRRKQEEELRSSKAQLEEAFSDLKNTQSQLALSEKLALLGQLVAGVAHEINTPVGAAKASAQNMQDVMPDLLQRIARLMEVLDHDLSRSLVTMLEAAYHRRPQLSTKEERALRRTLQGQLEEMGLTYAEDAARQLVEIGFSLPLEPYVPLLRSAHGAEALAAVYRLGQVLVNLENISIASDKTRNIVLALKRYTHTSAAPDSLEPVSLVDNIQTILILYAHQIRQQAVLETDFKANVTVQANSDRLGQIWTNLITNSLQAMAQNNGSQGSGKISIDLTTEQGKAIVRVADNGPGIPPHVLPRIFEPFYTTKPKGEGTGLGLSICKQIIEGYGGTMSATSEPGNTVFTIILPVWAADPNAAAPVALAESL